MSIFQNHSSQWKKAEKAQVYKELPDGDYIFTIITARGATTMSGQDIIEWTLEATDENGEIHLTRKSNFLNDAGYPYIKADIAAMGVDPDDIEFAYMDAWLEYFKGAVVKGHVTNKTSSNGKTYNNIYFNELVQASSKEEPDQNGFAPVEDSELPF